MDGREETGQISGSDFADQHGFAAVYCFARLYPAFRKKRSDHKGVFGLSLNPYGWLGVVVMQTLFFSSLNALMIIGMLRKMDMSLVRASFDLGASSGYTLWRIVVPLLKPVLLSCFCFRLSGRSLILERLL